MFSYKDIKKSLFKFYSVVKKSDSLRVEKLVHYVYSLVKQGESSLESIGAGLPAQTDQESRVKQVKRFLQSKYTDGELLFFPFIRALLAGIAQKRAELVLVIDGTDLGKHCGALMLSVVLGKRAIPLVWLVKEGNKGHFSIIDHLCLLQQLKALLATCPKVILLGDGEFDSWGLQEYASEQGWSYVLRTSKNTLIEDVKCDRYAVGELYVDTQIGHLLVENCGIGKQGKGCVNVLVWHEKREKEPIYLLSNLAWAKEMMVYYQKRWSIETLFSDLKSRGFNIHKTRIKHPAMLDNLLILVAIAFCLCFIMGLAKPLFRDILPMGGNPQIFRKDRLKNYSIFHIGKKILDFCVKNNTCFYTQFCKTLKHYFCVRF
jgi:hypothetical protein